VLAILIHVEYDETCQRLLKGFMRTHRGHYLFTDFPKVWHTIEETLPSYFNTPLEQCIHRWVQCRKKWLHTNPGAPKPPKHTSSQSKAALATIAAKLM
jgi:hypothetical protein